MCAVIDIGTHLFPPVSNSVASKVQTFQASHSQMSQKSAFYGSHLHWHCIYAMYRPIVPFHPMNVLILQYDIHIPYRRCDSLIVQVCRGHHSDDAKPEQLRTPSRYCPALSRGGGSSCNWLT